MKEINKKNKYKYDLGSFVQDQKSFSNLAGAGGQLGTMLGGVIGGSTGNAISGLASGAAAGAALGPIGAGIGGAIGLAGSLLGNRKQARAKALLDETNRTNYSNAYKDRFNSNMDTSNDNPYGMVFANGGLVPTTEINIEKGELQIDPETGKVIREYTGINPETGGMYEDHSKKQDTKHNFVTAEPGTFIITKKLAKDYKSSIDNNDKVRQNTILQNIKNYKDEVQPTAKMATGGGIPYANAVNAPYDPYAFINSLSTPQLGGVSPVTSIGTQPATKTTSLSGNFTNPYLTPSGSFTRPTVTQGNSGNGLSSVLNTVGNYAPALANIGQGLFGKVDQTAQAQQITNPYRSQVLNNLPQDVNLSPLLNRLYRNQNTQFNQIDQQTSSSAVARANKTNVFANTQNKIGDLYFDQTQANNQIRGQRANIYGNLGAQDMQEQARVQQMNLGIDQSNQQNRAAKTNLLNTGLGQLQQTFQNGKTINQQKANDAMRNKLLYEMFPNLRFYKETFGG